MYKRHAACFTRALLLATLFLIYPFSLNAEVGEMAKIADNDVYLMTAHVWNVWQRFQDGENVDLDVEFEKEIGLHPNYPSSYLWAALPKVRRLFINRENLHRDTKVLPYLQSCVDLAHKATKIKGLRDSGNYHLAMCEAGLAFYSGIRRDYFDAHSHGIKAFDSMKQLMKDRPNLHAALLIYGIYNYYTGIFGPFTKAILYLIGFTPGDKPTGLKQVERASVEKSPFRFLAQVFLTNLYSARLANRRKGVELCDELIKEHPKNYLPYMLKGEVLIRYPRYKSAMKAYRQARKLIPESSTNYNELMVSADVLLIQMRMAWIRSLTERHTASLKWLNRFANLKRSNYNDGPLLANVLMGHIYSMAGMDDKAQNFYKAVDRLEHGEWVKDVAKKYQKRPIRKRGKYIRFHKKNKDKLRKWLEKYPEIKPRG